MEKVPFDVYDCKVDTLPEWTNHIQLTHDFLICSESNLYTVKLQQFLGKRIFQLNEKIYWFDGEMIIDSEQPTMEVAKNVESHAEVAADGLKTETYLPNWLDDFIFNNMGAEYAPNFQRFDYNLNLTEEENLKYLGTYFPRSYAESFCIFDNIFQNQQYQNIFSQKNTLNVLTVGCGSGGDLVGLLTIIEKYCSAAININIWAIDGNTDALTILERIVNRFQQNSSKKINLKVYASVFTSIADMDLSQYKIGAIEFDFILSFKMICEIIYAGKGIYDNSYYNFVMKFVPLLSDDGLCVLLDVTTKAGHTTFNPVLMNRQVNQALRELKNYQTLLPLSCNLYEEICRMDCFCQQIFTISHSKYSANKSKVAYRVIASRLLNDRIAKPATDMQYRIQSNRGDVCLHTTKYESKADSYKLKS